MPFNPTPLLLPQTIIIIILIDDTIDYHSPIDSQHKKGSHNEAIDALFRGCGVGLIDDWVADSQPSSQPINIQAWKRGRKSLAPLLWNKWSIHTVASTHPKPAIQPKSHDDDHDLTGPERKAWYFCVCVWTVFRFDTITIMSSQARTRRGLCPSLGERRRWRAVTRVKGAEGGRNDFLLSRINFPPYRHPHPNQTSSFLILSLASLNH